MIATTTWELVHVSEEALQKLAAQSPQQYGVPSKYSESRVVGPTMRSYLRCGAMPTPIFITSISLLKVLKES